MASQPSLDELRIVTLNIRHGGGRQIGPLTARLLGYDADLLVVTEFQSSKGLTLIQALEAAGYETTHPDTDPKRNAVLIASRHRIGEKWPFDEYLDPSHLWCVETAGITVCAAYLPVYTEQRVPYWESLIGNAKRGGVNLIMGDFNGGKNDLDRSPTGGKFSLPEMPDRLMATGYTDLWRDAHPGERDYSYYSSKGGLPYNGFRIDFAFADSELARCLIACTFDHTPRTLGETDHSALIVSLAHTGENPVAEAPAKLNT